MARYIPPLTERFIMEELKPKQGYIVPGISEIVHEYEPCYELTANGLYCGFGEALGEAEGENKENPFSYLSEDKKSTVSCVNKCRFDYCIPWITNILNNVPSTVRFTFPDGKVEDRKTKNISFGIQILEQKLEEVEPFTFKAPKPLYIHSTNGGRIWFNPTKMKNNAAGICEDLKELKERKLKLTFSITLDPAVEIKFDTNRNPITPIITFPGFPRGFFGLKWTFPSYGLYETRSSFMFGSAPNVNSIIAELILPAHSN